jgi:hypothetical protein
MQGRDNLDQLWHHNKLRLMLNLSKTPQSVKWGKYDGEWAREGNSMLFLNSHVIANMIEIRKENLHIIEKKYIKL